MILDASSEGIEAAAFASDGTTIQIETRRGPETPVELRDGDPTTPLYEIDVRFVDSEGFPFFILLGGHEPIDPTWRQPLSESAETEEISAARAKAQYAAATAFLRALAKSDFAASVDTAQWAPERETLLNVAQRGITDAAAPRAEALPDTTSPKFHSVTAATTTYTWRIEIHKQGFWFASNTLGDHSATVSRSTSNSGVVQQTIITSNHGTAANNMPLSCPYSMSAGTRKTLPAAPLCTTSYGLTSGKHVCNDDTYIQYQTIRNALCPDPSAGTCADGSLRRYAPACW